MIFIIGVTSANYPGENNIGPLPLKNFTPEQPLKNYYSTEQEKPVRLSSFGTEGEIDTWKNKLSFQVLQLIDNSTTSSLFGSESLKMQLERQHLFIPAYQPFMGNLTADKDLVLVEIEFDPTRSDGWESELFTIVDLDNEGGIVIAYVPLENIRSLTEQDAIISVRFVIPSIIQTGLVNTEGDAIHHASEVRINTPFRGDGIKVGVISDSVDHLAEAQASGDLPYNVHVLRNSNPLGHTDEGIAMLEIIHDLAPGAELYFHDGGGSSTGFNNAVNALQAAGCDIICDDLTMPDQPSFEDGPVSSHVKNILSSNDIVYITSAGNYAEKHYQGFFYDQGNNFHDFSSGADPDYKYLYLVLGPGGSATVVLQWSDKWGQSGNDYDIGIYDENGALVAVSMDVQNGNDNPFEYCSIQNIDINHAHYGTIAVAKSASSQYRNIEVFIFTSGIADVAPNNTVLSDSIFEHPAVTDVIAVGAIDSQDTGNDDIEPFSSQGPVTIMYPYRETRMKPDICGIDNVRVTGAGYFPSPFSGTSASAPHVAGIVALIWSANPSLSAGEIRSALLSSADDRGTPGIDPVFGYGLANAQKMLSLVYTPAPTTTPTTTIPTTTIPTTTTPTTPIPTTTIPTTTIPTTTIPTTSVSPTSTYSALVADFLASRNSGDAPLKVKFEDNSQGNPTGWMWDINGDGFQDYSERTFEHTYTTPGYYTVTLSVTRNQELNAVTKTGFIHVLSPSPTATPTTTPVDDLSLTLYPGWNFIASPHVLANGHNTAAEVFDGIDLGGRSIFRYDSDRVNWVQIKTTDTLNPMDGIWIYTVNQAEISLKFNNSDSIQVPAKHLSPGWNSIGFSQHVPINASEALQPIQNSWTLLFGYNSQTQAYDTSIINGGTGTHRSSQPVYPGKGYWIFVNSEGTLI